MKKALISTLEPKEYFDGSKGLRVTQVENSENIFEVHKSLYWMDCADDVTADEFYFDLTTNTIKPIPIPPPKEQPVTEGLTSV